MSTRILASHNRLAREKRKGLFIEEQKWGLFLHQITSKTYASSKWHGYEIKVRSAAATDSARELCPSNRVCGKTIHFLWISYDLCLSDIRLITHQMTTCQWEEWKAPISSWYMYAVYLKVNSAASHMDKKIQQLKSNNHCLDCETLPVNKLFKIQMITLNEGGCL